MSDYSVLLISGERRTCWLDHLLTIIDSVGVGGHVIHGGFGFSSHTHGLALDWLVGARVVLADGSLVYASERQNSDLFWAIRGAGSSFGIAVEFEFKTFPLPQTLSWFRVKSDVTAGTKKQAVNGLLAFQEVVATGGIHKNLNLRLGIGGGQSQGIEAVFHGSVADGRAALEVLTKPLKLDWASPNSVSGSGDWLEHIEEFAYGDALNITYPYEGVSHIIMNSNHLKKQLLIVISQRQNAYTSSLVTPKLTKAAVTSWVDYWFDHARNADTPGWWGQMDVYGDPNSGVVATPEWATSYVHRDKLWLWQLSAVFDDVSADTTPGISFLNGLMNSIKDPLPAGSWGRYANYIDSELDRNTALKQYYGAHLERLKGIKTHLDPLDLFHYPQSIPSWYR